MGDGWCCLDGGEAAAAALAQSLLSNTTLTSLDLGETELRAPRNLERIFAALGGEAATVDEGDAGARSGGGGGRGGGESSSGDAIQQQQQQRQQPPPRDSSRGCGLRRLHVGRALIDKAAGAALASSLGRGAALELLSFENFNIDNENSIEADEEIDVCEAAERVATALLGAGPAARLRVLNLTMCRLINEGETGGR